VCLNLVPVRCTFAIAFHRLSLDIPITEEIAFLRTYGQPLSVWAFDNRQDVYSRAFNVSVAAEEVSSCGDQNACCGECSIGRV